MDFNAAASVAISQSIARQSVKSANCRDCGSHMVTWVKSPRTGRSYLADATYGTPGKVIPGRTPHNAGTCARIQAENAAKQAQETATQNRVTARIARNRALSIEGDTYQVIGMRAGSYVTVPGLASLEAALVVASEFTDVEVFNERTNRSVHEQH